MCRVQKCSHLGRSTSTNKWPYSRCPGALALGETKHPGVKRSYAVFFAQIVSSGPHTPTEESLRSSLRNWPQELETFTRDSDYKNLKGFKNPCYFPMLVILSSPLCFPW